MLQKSLLSFSFLIFLGCQTVPDVPVCIPLPPKKNPEYVIQLYLCRQDPECKGVSGVWEHMYHSDHGWCTYTISDEDFYVDDKHPTKDGLFWSDFISQSVLISAKDYAKIKAAFINNCKKSKECNHDIAKWEKKTNKISDRMGTKK